MEEKDPEEGPILPKAADFRVSDTPIWRQPCFFGEFGDAFIQHSDLEGAPTEPSLVMLCDLIAKCCQKSKSELTLFNKDDLGTMRFIHADLIGALDFARSCSSTDAGFVDCVDRMVHRLLEMGPGDRQVILGGWASKTKSAHAIVTMVECTGTDTFAWVCCNTGQGVEDYHPLSYTEYPERKCKTAIRFDGIDKKQIANPDIWYMILKQTAQASDSHTPETLYEIIIPHLLGKEKYELTERDLEFCGNWERPQKSGTCYYRCLLTALRYLMKDYELSVDQQRQLFVYIRVNYLNVVKEHLQNAEFLRTFNESDRYLINLAIRETGISSVRMSARLERLLPEARREGEVKKFLEGIERSCAEVTSFLPVVELVGRLSVTDPDGMDARRPSDATTELIAFTGFDLVFDESEREQKKGYRASGTVPVYLDLLCPVPKPAGGYSLEGHTSVLMWCHEMCDSIRSRSNVTSITTVLHQMTSFIEHVFLQIFDCPSEFHYLPKNTLGPTSSPNYESDAEQTENFDVPMKPSISSEPNSIWRYNGDLSAESQNKALSALFNIALHYVSAVKSLNGDRSSRTVASFTMGIIYVFFDAILRVKTTGKSANGTENSIIATLLDNAFGASMISCPLFEDATIFDLLEGCNITRPEIAIARDRMFTYHAKLKEREEDMKLKNIFKYEVLKERFFYISFSADAEMVRFVRVLRAALDPEFLLEPEKAEGGRTVDSNLTGQTLSETESIYSWFASQWTKSCPEFALFRDINVLFQLMLNPELMFTKKSEGKDKVWSTFDARVIYYYSCGSRDKTTVYYLLQLCNEEFIFPSRTLIDSPLDVQSLIDSNVPLTETRVLIQQSLPNFDNALSPQEAEQLFSYLAFPYISIPLLLNFFSGDRIGLLLNRPIQNILEAVLLQPGQYKTGSSIETANGINLIPADSRSLSTSLGILMEECMYNSAQLLAPLKDLCENAMSLCVGGYQSSVVDMLLFLVRQTVRIVSMSVHHDIQSVELSEFGEYLPAKIGRRIQAWALSASTDNDVIACMMLYSHAALIFSVAIDIEFMHNEADDNQISQYIEGFLCAAGYVVSWNSKANSVSAMGGKSELSCTPVSEVFYCLQRQKSRITKWSKDHLDPINKVLDAMVSLSLQHPFSECGGWQQSNREPMVCSLHIENEQHPYPPCSDWSQTVSFPGASSINVYFDGRSCTEANADYVLISYPGCNYRFEGPAHSNWPGAHGSPPLVIPSDTFVVEFHSDGSIQEWGFALTAIAPISQMSTHILVEETGLSSLACQLALRKCHNFIDTARCLIDTNREEVIGLEKTELARRYQQQESDASPGLFQDSIDYVQVNLQSAEVFINNRVNIPVPSDIYDSEGFVAVFKGLDVPSCTILADNTNRFSIQVLCPEEQHGCYEIEAWRPLQPYGVTGSGRGAVIRDQDDTSDNGRCTSFNLPIAAPTIEFCGVKFSNYVKGSCGWLSELFDKCNLLGSELEGIWCSESATSLPALTDPILEDEVDAFILMKVHCSTDGQDLVQVMGHPGAWFEVRAPRGKRDLLAFILVDHGRRVQRQLVFSTNGNRALMSLPSDPSERTKPIDPLFVKAKGNIMGGFKDWKGEILSWPGVGGRQQERIGSIIVRRSRVPTVNKAVEDNSSSESTIFCAIGGLISDDQLAELENFALEEYLPVYIMASLIPECLTENFQFWRTGSRIIRGYHYISYDNNSRSPSVELVARRSRVLGEESILIVLDETGHSATVHRLVNGRRQFTLIDASQAKCGSFLFDVAKLLGHVECLSHILFWTNSSFCGEQKCELSRIELQRLGTSLDIRHSSSQSAGDISKVDYVLSDHDDLALQFDTPIEITSRWGGIASFLVFANSSSQFYLFLPNYGFSTPTVLMCPFQSNLIYDCSTEWHKNVETRFYIYPVHPAFTYLEFPDFSAALYWTLLSFVRHQYTACAELIRTVCRSDIKLSHEQRWILSLVPKTDVKPNTAVYSHPDANACRLLFALLCVDCGEDPSSDEFKKQFWDTEKDYLGYMNKISYISHSCRLTTAQEAVILSIFPRVSQIRKGYIDALDRLPMSGDDSFEVLPTRMFTKECEPAKVADMISILNMKAVPSSATQARLPEPKKLGKVVYERPLFRSPGGLMAALNSIWSSFEFASQRAKKSEFAYSGFILMYELLTGELVLNFKTTGILLPFDDENAANFWTPLAEKPESAVLSTGPTDVAVSSGVATMAPADCMMAAEALFAMDLIPDVTTEQLSMLLSIYGGSQENLIEDYFSDPDKVMAKLTLPYVDAGSSDASLHAEAEILFNNEIFGGLEVQEIEHLLKMHSGDSATAVSAYFDSPEEVVRSIQQSIQSTLAAKIGTDTGAPSLRLTGEKENKNVPSNFPLSWQLVKLVVHALCLQFPALKTKKEVCILLALITDIERRIIDISKKGAHDCTFFPPLFPYYDNKADLKSLEGMESNAYENFLADTSAYALKVLYETQYRSDDSKKTNITQPRLKDFIGPFIGRAKPEPLQPDISNYSCYDRCVDMVALSNSEWQNRLSVADIGALLSCPLKILSCFGDITCTMRTEAVSSIPFDLSLHPTAVGNPPAVAMLSRIKSDLQQNDKATEYGLSYLNGIDEVTNCEQARALLAGVCSEKLAQMINELKVLMASDTKSVLTGIIALEGLMNGISAGMISNEWNKFQFMYTACRRRRIWFEYYVASLASTNQVSDLHALNPFLDEATINIINSRVMCVLMQFVRMRQASVCIHRASVLMKTIRDVQNLIKVDSCTAVQCVDAVHVLRHELAELVSELRKERHYIDDKNGLPCLDPRFLIFEFLTGFLLRRRQVELVNDFISAHRERRSSVHQMIMGAGKTQVIAPLLALMLADGNSLVSFVCPSPLLQQSRTQFRNRFSSVLPKNIVTLKFERAASEFSSVGGLQKLLKKLMLARSQRSIVLTNPQSIKSMLLKYIDFLLQLRKLPSTLRIFAAGSYTGNLDMATAARYLKDSLVPFEKISEMADLLGKILKMWGRDERGIALLDEVDMILHPLKSELNFPIGESEQLPLMPERFDLPMYLLDLFLSHGEVSKIIPHSIVHIWNEISNLINVGRHKMIFQSVPHLVLLNEKYYFSEMIIPISWWAVTWLRQQSSVMADIIKIDVAKEGEAVTDQYLINYICASGKIRKNAAAMISTHCTEKTIQLLNLTREWVLVYLPHVISKIHRVSYGLIAEDDITRWVNQEIVSAGGDKAAGQNVIVSKSRRLLAVPFDGKDSPSKTSEFANPEIQIGLSIMAYRLNGLRKRDTKDLISHLKHNFSTQPGPFRGRPARIQFEEWKAQCVVDSFHDEAVSANVLEILPLELLQNSDSKQLDAFQGTLGNHSNVVSYYMSHLVFPRALEQKAHKIQANGVDLGSDMIFGARFGFSGTPSDLLPRELQPCYFERGCEAEVFRVLSSSLTVCVPTSLTVGKNWTVDDLLTRVATGGYSSLIDTGALITGYTAEEVARKILKLQKLNDPHRKEVCVYLNEHDVKMAVTLDDGPAVELDRCGAKLEKRFVFYDHVHTTGIDIKHALNAVAVCTLGKDMTLRDYAQGCWRMRGLGKGQRIHILLIEEVSTLIQNTQCTENLLNDVLAWLLTNSFKSEKAQFIQLQSQSLANVWRRSAYEMLLKEKQYFAIDTKSNIFKDLTASKLQNALSEAEFLDLTKSGMIPLEWLGGSGEPKLNLDISKIVEGMSGSDSIVVGIENDMLQLGIDLFLEPTSNNVSSSADVDRSRSAMKMIMEQVEAYRNFIKLTAQGESTVQSILEVLISSLDAGDATSNSENGDGDLEYNDREIVQEQEKEKDEEREKEVFQVVHPENDGDDEGVAKWDLSGLFDFSQQTAALSFYPLKDLVINEMRAPSKLAFPDDLFVSQAHTPYFHTSTGCRRMKNVTCILAWHAKISAAKADPEPELDVMEIAVMSTDDAPLRQSNDSFFTFLGIAKKWRNKIRKKGSGASGSDSNVALSSDERCGDIAKTNLQAPSSFHCCILSLAEAETLQFVINRRSDLKKIVSIHCVDSVRTGAPLTAPIADCFSGSQYHKKFDALLQCASFFDNNLYFDYDSLILLLDSLGALTTTSDREAIFKETMKGRLRDQTSYAGSPVNWLFIYENKMELQKLCGYCSAFQKCLQSHFASYINAFEHFSNNKFRQLTASHIFDGLHRLSSSILSIEEAEAMVNYIWNSRLRTEQSIGLGLLDFEMLFPPPVASEIEDMLNKMALGDVEGMPGFAPRMMRQKSSYKMPVNEFYSRIHIPSISSIGKWIVIGGTSAQTSRARLNMSNDFKMSVHGVEEADGLVTISPRAVSLKSDNENMWCFELSVIKQGDLNVGFASAGHHHLPRSQKIVSLISAVPGTVIRIIINLKTETVTLWEIGAFNTAQSAPWSTDTIPTHQITNDGLDFGSGIYPFLMVKANVLFQLNDGSMPFSSVFGSMPMGCHSLSHWIRREQEKNYVCYRHSLGTFGRISFMSGGQQLEVAKLNNWSPHDNIASSSPTKSFKSAGETKADDHVWELMPPKDIYKLATRNHYESSFPTIFLDGVLLTQGQWYYEVTCGCKNVAVQLGWSDLDSLQSNDSGLGVGDDKHSWAIDGDRRCLWHNGSIPYGKEWKIGDVCGISCNLDVNNRSISFSLNGEWFKPVAFPNIDFTVGLTPALTVQGVQPGDKKTLSYIANFGPYFKYPPGGQYRAVSEYIEWGRREFISPTSGILSPAFKSNLGDEDDLGPNIDELPHMRMIPLGRQASAQPDVVPNDKLRWVPVAVRSGYGQVSVEDPIFTNGPAVSVISRGDSVQGPCVRKTVVCTTGHDDSSYPSVTGDRVMLRTGKWCYEVDITDITTTAACSIGFSEVTWSEANWATNKGVGNDAFSFGIFYKVDTGVTSCWNDVKREASFVELAANDGKCGEISVCVAVDCDEKKMYLSVNNGEIITALEGLTFSALAPAISIQARGAAKKAKQKREAELPEQTKIEINFGEAPFKNMAFILNGFAPVLTKITGTPTL